MPVVCMQQRQVVSLRGLANRATVVPTKSDSDLILCLQLLSKTLTCTLHLSIRESIDHLSLCINPILWIGQDMINTQVIYLFRVPDNFVNKT